METLFHNWFDVRISNPLIKNPCEYHDNFLILPTEVAILSAKFNASEEISPWGESFYLELIKSSGVNVRKIDGRNFIRDDYYGNQDGKALFKISPTFFRGEISPNNIKGYNNIELEEFLQDDNYNIHPYKKEIEAVAKEIKYKIPIKNERNNYWLINEILDWLKDNIKHSDEIPPVSNFLKKILMNKGLSKEDIEKSEKLMGYLKDEGLLIFSQDPSMVLRYGVGNCSGISNLFVSIARNLGVPSKVSGGYVSNGKNSGAHAWVISYLHPYGWVEIEPQNGIIKDYNRYAYPFSRCNNDKLPTLTMIERENGYFNNINERLDEKVNRMTLFSKIVNLN
ncbi:transglutaminase domain-containing protein [Candidatus Woesearchaeota archaeon]|nr:transglutaminase domain-containing protein [Candidatus Woesearchaeota archaeon]